MNNNYAMYLITPSGVELAIPVLPETLAVTGPGKNETAQVLGLGEVLLLRRRGLGTVAWEGVFPAGDAPFVTGERQEPSALIAAIQTARDSREPLRLLVLGGGLDMNAQMGVEDFDYEERFGELGDVYYSIQLRQWRPWGARTLTVSDGAAAQSEAERTGAPQAPKSYTVVSGDCLWTIARRFYGSGARWRTIYDANRAVVGANPNLIYPGQVLTIP